MNIHSYVTIYHLKFSLVVKIKGLIKIEREREREREREKWRKRV